MDVLELSMLKLGLGECGGVTLEFMDLGLCKLKRFNADTSGANCQPNSAPFAAPAMTICNNCVSWSLTRQKKDVNESVTYLFDDSNAAYRGTVAF